ncbi:hypothetical protein RM545_13785 [Zunongwangia sp. F260]|uniref:Uncharacterized protein n=1 Tax=Autumnicola lenta TaxID=3075593 RepID=A0ABU3CN31_9FLAO|nr:hypothetical protein [Zunongwangia sp. F260]MDT0647766.1 hypothetical protein [Zunongwangia sp. F260]
MKNFILILIISTFIYQMQAQTVDEIIENGIPLKKDEAIFLKYDERKNAFRYATAYSRQDITRPIKPISLLDSTIFLSRHSEVPVYILPFNPLNYSTSTDMVFIKDQINEDAGEAMGIINQQVQSLKSFNSNLNSILKGGTPVFDPPPSCDKKFKEINSSLEKLKKKIEDYKKENKISKNFKILSALTFQDETITIRSLDEISSVRKGIDSLFSSLSEQIELINNEIDTLQCESTADKLVYQLLSRNLVKDLNEIKEIEKQKFIAFNKVFDLVKKHQEKASIGGGVDGLRWLYPLDFISSSRDKISVFTINIKKGGYSINEKEEIVAKVLKDTLKNTIRVRRFQRFIPEVSVGTAFTFFKYQTYGTVTDSTGQNFVGSPVEKELRNLNITTMVNFNYYIPDSPLHPFYQLGFGVNEGIPTLLTGVGLRSALGIRRFSISAGIAATWIEELNNLEVGDPVSGTAEIEEDLKYQFSWPPKPYIGLQFNF